MTRPEEKHKLRQRKRMVDQAIGAASHSRWAEAIELNQRLLELGEDIESYNRLGKALLELGRLPEALETYRQSYNLSPANPIARRNMARLEALIEKGVPDAETATPGKQIDVRLFLSETGKTCITTVLDPADIQVLGRLSSGDELSLEVSDQLIQVRTLRGELVGYLDPRLSHRLREMMGGGNTYMVAVAAIIGTQIKVLIRETFQHPAMRGKLSFPGKLSGDLASFRPYVRGDLGRYDYDPDELMDDEDLDDEVEETFRGDDEEEVGLEEVDNDSDDDDAIEE